MLGEYLRLALKTLRAYRMRSTLTVLSITIGVMAVIILTSLAQSGLATLSKGIEEIGGTRLILLWQDSPKKAAKKQGNYLKGLTQDDAKTLREHVDLIDKLTAFQEKNQVSVRRPGASEAKTDQVGADTTFITAYAMHLAEGRNLSEVDLAERRQVCLVGDDLAKKVFGKDPAVGQDLNLNGRRFRVVGRLAYAAKTGMNMGFSWNDLAIVPLGVMRPDGGVGMVTLVSRDPGRNGELLDRANALLLHRHNGVDDFQFMDFAGMLKNFYAVFFGMILLVGLISGMSLLIGGVGIMNIMLVAVTERRREIGLRKAVGANEGTIRLQFLIESIVLSLFGAVIGTVLGVLIAWGAAKVGPMINRDWVGLVSMPAVLLAILAAAGIGLFFGWWPARQAAKLDPILALRSE